MYKILVKQLNTSKNLFKPYTEAVVNPETGEATTEMVEYETDDLTVLADKYKELLASYTTEQIKLVEELDAELIITIEDN